MEDTLQIFLSVAPAIATAIFGWLFREIKKRDERKAAEDHERAVEERKRIDTLETREEAINEALRALCRDRILQGYRYYRRTSGVTTADLETMTKLYNAYHKLEGNGTVTAVYEKILALPIKEETHEEPQPR